MASPRPIRLAVLALVVTAVMVALRLFTAAGETGESGQTPESAGEAASAVEVSGPMPELSGEALVGGTVDPALYRGKVVVVNFWASWCAPCRREQPVLQRLWEDYGDRGVQFLGVNHRDDRGEAISHLREFRVTYPSVADDDEALARAFRVPYLPTTIIADARGELRWRLPGEQDHDTLERLLERLLTE